MNNKEFSVEILNNNHIDQISNIWIKSLPNNLKSIIGRKLINKYIEEFFKTEENLGIGLLAKLCMLTTILMVATLIL